jgi:hypothetical protein
LAIAPGYLSWGWTEQNGKGHGMMQRWIAAAVTIALLGLGTASTDAQQASQTSADTAAAPCDIPEARQFDFWVGDWDLTWGEDGKGTNHITKILDSCVIKEEFDGTPSIRLKGISVSTYSRPLRKWQQTWVDNSGGYLDFSGGMQDGRMVLTRQATRDGKRFLQRMVWYNIGESELDWNWERSGDQGKTWEVLWKIHYVRRK